MRKALLLALGVALVVSTGALGPVGGDICSRSEHELRARRHDETSIVCACFATPHTKRLLPMGQDPLWNHTLSGNAS